jgi:hypothetical protein
LIEAVIHAPWRKVIVFSEAGLTLRHHDFEGALRSENFRENGAHFWSRSRGSAKGALWRICGMEPPAQPIDGRVAVVDRDSCWRALHVWARLCEHRYLFVDETGGDLGALRFALCALEQRIAVAANQIAALNPRRTGIRDRSA